MDSPKKKKEYLPALAFPTTNTQSVVNPEKNEYFLTPNPFEDLTLVVVGEEHCLPAHSHGPKSRAPYLFHYVFSGTGFFTLHGKKYEVHANQGFLIPDSSIIYYATSASDPWHYGWIQIQGEGARTFFDTLSLTGDSPIYTAKSDENGIFQAFKTLFNQANQTPNDPFSTRAALYSFLGELVKCNTNKLERNEDFKTVYVKSAELYIINNAYSENFRIEDLAKYIGIDRSYLTRLFTEYFHISPQDYLIRYRMNKARNLIKTTTTPIGVIASSVGYIDISTFSKIYKKYFGFSPNKDRQASP